MPAVNYDSTRVWWNLYRWRIEQGELQDHPQFGEMVGYSRTGAYHLFGASRTGLLEWHRNYWRGLTEDYRWVAEYPRPQTLLSIPTDAAILFVGAGFGFLAEAARSLGWTNSACLDDSNWIDEHKGDLAWRWDGGAWVQDTPNQIETVLVRGLSPANSLKNTLKGIFTGPAAATGEPDWLITESVVAGLIDPTDPLYRPGEGEADELNPFYDECDAVVSATGTVVHIADVTARAPFNVKTLAGWKATRPAHTFASSHYTPRYWEIL